MTTTTETIPATTAKPATKPQTGRPTTRTVAPPVDVFETDQSYVVLADIPGVKRDGLEVVTERDLLILKGRVDTDDTNPTYQEFELADYRRMFMMTEDLDPAGITATLRDGVVRIEIPKSSRLQARKIEVRTA